MRPEQLVGQRFFYGWAVVAAAFALCLAGWGGFYAFGTYFESLSREYGADRGSVSFVFSLGLLIYSGLSAVTGPLVDRFGPRRVAALAAVAFLIGFGLASRAGSLWHIYLTYSLFIGFAVATTYVPAMSTVQRWFVKRRALASGLTVSGIGAGATIVPALGTWLIARYDWRMAFLVTGVTAAVLTIGASWFLIRSPAELGLAPDGGPAGRAATTGEGASPFTDLNVRQAIGTPEHAWLYLAVGLTCLPGLMVFAHLVQSARDAGLDAATATLSLGALGIGQAIGRLLLSPWADHFGRRRSYALFMAGMAILMMVWLVLPLSIVPVLLAFGVLFGSMYGGFAALYPVQLADYFGPSFVSGLLGLSLTGAGLGLVAGPWLGGVLYDSTGSYRIAILIGAAAAALSSVIIFRLRSPEEFRAAYAARTADPAMVVHPTPALGPDH